MKKSFFALLASFSSFVSLASVAVTESSIRVRWPLSPTVDIDFRLEGDEHADVVLCIQGDGMAEPLTLAASALSRPTLGLEPGYHHVEWNPKVQGCTARRIRNARLTATVVPASSRTYLVVNLATGESSYLAEAPADGFANVTYKTDYMVFRRIPAGTYQVGDSDAASTRFQYSANDKVARGARTVRVTTDYYLALYMMTVGQFYHFDGQNKGRLLAYCSYCENCRGSVTNGVDNILWPTTGHRVVDGSIIDQLRKRFKLPDGAVLDVPTSVMWEIGARAGSATSVYPNGGAITDTDAELQAVRESESLYQAGDVGQKNPNPWGFYDVLGIAYELVLDGANYTSATGTTQDNPYGILDRTQVVDPVGVTATPDNSYRYVACNAGWGWNKLTCTASWRAILREGNGKPGIRPCIYLRPLVK